MGLTELDPRISMANVTEAHEILISIKKDQNHSQWKKATHNCSAKDSIRNKLKIEHGERRKVITITNEELNLKSTKNASSQRKINSLHRFIKKQHRYQLKTKTRSMQLKSMDF